MSKVELDPITSGYNLSKINNNFQKVEDELNNKVLYRETTTGEPNSMGVNLDMDSNDILNVDELGANSVSTEVLEIGGVPVVPGNIFIDPNSSAREALRRSYAEAGRTMVSGSFEQGGTITTPTQVLLYGANGKGYSWGGALPKVVPTGSTPTSSGGIGALVWTDRSAEIWTTHMPFGDSTRGVMYRPGVNYESAGTSSSQETRPWYHDFRPLGIAQGGDAVFSTDGANMFLGPGAGNFTMRPLPIGSIPPGVDYNLQCSHNIGIGLQALGSVTIGYKNTGIGTNTWRKLTQGHGNTATGRDCGHELTVGNDNSFYGFTSGFQIQTGDYNCVFGTSAGYNNAGGTGNSIYGRRASFSQTSGSYNQVFGEQAGSGFISGDYNTFIGKQSSAIGLSTGDSNLIIGSRVSGLQDENRQVVIADGAGNKTLEVHKDSVPTIKKASYLDLPSYEATAFNAAATDGQLSAGSSIVLRSLANTGSAVTQVVFQSRVGQPYSRIVSTAAGAGQMVFINDNIERLRILSAGGVNPGIDNTQPLGSSSKRWSEVFAGTGTINTSDGREKSVPLVVDDAILDAWADVKLVTFQWLESIRLKGEGAARWHFGVIAQQVRDTFIAHGIDGTNYGLLCYDEWGDEYQEVLDENGEPSGEKVLVAVGGDRWGIRADQCLFLEAAYQRRRCDRIETRLSMLEEK